MDGQFEAFNTIAATHEVSPAVVCLAWHLAKAPVVIPIPGATRAASILDSVQAADVTLTAEELAVLDAA
jgi:aryl-alcohol dehydrogenase-like predicted oxidoreductase